MTVQISTRIEEDEKTEFEKIAKSLGLTPADAIRVFIKVFSSRKGFPFEVKQTTLKYSHMKEIPFDKKLGRALLPVEWNCKEDDIYDDIYGDLLTSDKNK